MSEKRLWCKTCGKALDTFVGVEIGSAPGLLVTSTCPHCGATHDYTIEDFREKKWWQR